jgi:D-alanine-D-alanine ligase
MLEANPNPNLAREEDFAESARAAGMGYTALLERIMTLGRNYRVEWRDFNA